MEAIASAGGVNNVFSNAQRLLLNTAFPDTFEYYMLAFEVIDSDNVPVERFTFPVLPSTIRQSETTIKNIEKTFGGVTTNFSTSFVPYPINLSGNFGRKLRFTAGLDTPQMAKYTYTDPSKASAPSIVRKSLSPNPRITTGFGYTQKLKAVFRYGKAVDKKGNPYRIVFYNMAANEVVFVEMDSLVTEMSEDKNMIWVYNMQMTAVAGVPKIRLKEKFGNTTGDGGAGQTSEAINNIGLVA